MRWLVAIACLLIGAEVSTRVLEALFVPYPVALLTDLVSIKGDHWTLRPHAKISQVERAGNVSYAINAEGYRGSLPPGPKSGKRIVFLGDSVTFGLGAEEDDTFVRLLEARLAGSVGPMEAINLALFSYSPHEYLTTWRRLGCRLAPDVVVLQLYMNDFDAKPFDAPRSVNLSNALTVLWIKMIHQSAFARRAYQGAHMAFYYWLRPLRRQYFPNHLSDAEPRAMLKLLKVSGSLDAVDAMAQVHKLLREIKQCGARVVLLYSPHEVQLYSKHFDEIDRMVEETFAREADAYVDPLLQLRRAADRAAIFRDGLHYAKTGHRIVADALEGPLRSALGARVSAQ